MKPALAPLLFLATACANEVRCPVGTVRVGEVCRVDAPDASSDSGTTGGDGSQCAPRCNTRALSWCDGDTKQCRSCTSARECKVAGLAATPACQKGKGCVACTGEDDGVCATKPATPHCKVGGNTCVECNATSDCTADPNRPICDGDTCRGCTTAGNECGGKLCDEATGACVECTKDDRTACAVDANGKRDVCNAATRKCEVGVKDGTAPLCGTERTQCVSNDHCPIGSACVQEFLGTETFSDWYCLPTQGSALCARPFVGPASPLMKATRDGDATAVCGLRRSTCTAHSQYSGTSCKSDADPALGDNAKCGLPGIEDGYCVDGGTLGFRCTVACTGGDPVDCPDPVGPVDPTCTTQAHGADMKTDTLCTLQ